MPNVKFSNETGLGSQISVSFGNPRPKGPEYFAKLSEAMDLFGRAMSGNARAMIDLREAFSTSDFPYLFGDILSRELLPAYTDAPAVWTQFARRTVVRDFRPHRMIDLLGGQGLLDPVAELTEYPARSLSEEQYELTVRKHGARFAISWESLINDDLGGLRDLPNRLAVAARRSEDHLAASLLASATGPNPDFFSDTTSDSHPYDNLTDLPLTTDNLSTVLTEIQSRTDTDGAPLEIDGFVLVVPPALEVTARNILGATEIRTTDGDGNTIIVGNWLSGRVSLVVNPWLPLIDTSGNAATTWYVLPTPSSARPAVAVGFLRGHETPDLRVRSSDSQRVGGGDVPAEDGSFDNDDVQYRVRHVTGGATMDTISTMASTGDATG